MSKRKNQIVKATTEYQMTVDSAYRLGLQDGYIDGWNDCAVKAFGPLEKLSNEWAKACGIMASIRLVVITGDKIKKLPDMKVSLETLLDEFEPCIGRLQRYGEAIQKAADRDTNYLNFNGAWALQRAVSDYLTVNIDDKKQVARVTAALVQEAERETEFGGISIMLDIVRPTRDRQKIAPYEEIKKRVDYWFTKRNCNLMAAYQRVSEELWDTWHYPPSTIKTYYERARSDESSS